MSMKVTEKYRGHSRSKQQFNGPKEKNLVNPPWENRGQVKFHSGTITMN